jgi:nucleotide-binding universal stress UspA family protein
MYTNVLIGVDEEEGGRDAIALARHLVGENGKLSLAYVHYGYFVGRGSNPAFEATEHDRGMQVLERARADAGIEAELHCVGATSVGRGLHQLAEKLGADLLVVGSTRRSRVGRVLLGDDTSAALDGSPCAVVVAPAGYAQHPKALREIGVAYDESPESAHALDVGRALATERGAKLSAFEAVELPTYVMTGAPVPVDVPAEELLAEARQRLADLHEVEAHVVYGQPVEELSLFSASVDLLIIGSRGYGPVGRLVHGSTTRLLARCARCPLLVLTRAVRAADATKPEPAATVTAG